MACRICEKRPPKRFCPGVRGEICGPCCGEEREVTVSCPLDCEYLREARRHERATNTPLDQIPNADVKVTDSFLHENDVVVMIVTRAIAEALYRVPDAIDYDLREALEALIKTYRTLQSGLIYETRPANPIAGALQEGIKVAIADIQERLQKAGQTALRDAQFLGVLVFLQRVEYQFNNGRRRGRSFIDYVLHTTPRPQAPQPDPGSSLIVS